MYLFYSQYIFDEASEDKSILNINKTKIANALKKTIFFSRLLTIVKTSAYYMKIL
jgi:hypothetical protein